MKRKLIYFVIFFSLLLIPLFSTNVLATTWISGNITNCTQGCGYSCNVTASVTLTTNSVWTFDNIIVQPGITVTIQNQTTFDVSGDVNISGTISANGADGQGSSPYNGGNGGSGGGGGSSSGNGGNGGYNGTNGTKGAGTSAGGIGSKMFPFIGTGGGGGLGGSSCTGGSAGSGGAGGDGTAGYGGGGGGFYGGGGGARYGDGGGGSGYSLKIIAINLYLLSGGSITTSGGNGAGGGVHGGGGGGGGGEILINATLLSTTSENQIKANGGAGMTTGYGTGGNGGGGYVYLFYTTNSTTGAINVSAGSGGNGGSAGVVSWNYNANINNNFCLDETSPTYSKNTTNTTLAGQPCNFSLEANDNLALNPNGKYMFSTNNSGTWVNSSWTSFTATPQNMTNVTILNSTINTIVAWCFYFNDSAGNLNATSCTEGNQFILNATPDTTSPTWSNMQTSPASGVSYQVGQNYQFNITWTDNAGISDVILEFNGVNYTYSLGQLSNNGNVYHKTFSDLPVGSYTYFWYANDTSNNWNYTSNKILKQVSASADDCGYDLGAQWGIDKTEAFVGNGGGTVANAGFRWTDINIPQGSTIISSYFKPYASNSEVGPGNTKVYGINEANTSEFPNDKAQAEGRAKTGNFTSFNTSVGTSYDWREINITDIVKEIIDNSSWANGNSLGIYWLDSSSSLNKFYTSRAWDYSDHSYGAKINITWEYRDVNSTYQITKASTLATLYFNGSTSGQTSTYPNSTINATAVSNVSGLYVQLWENETLLANSTSSAFNITQWEVGYYNFTAQVLGNQNYSDSVPVTLWWNVSVGDTTSPTYSSNSTNSTLAGTPIKHSLNWSDNVGLSGYIFQFCNGTWNGTNCLGSSTNWLSGWSYRKQHNITNSTGADVNYTVNITVINATGTDSGSIVYINKSRSDFGDIRFTNSTGSLLNYWIENVTSGANATFWVQILGNLTSTNQTIYIYYGKADATNVSNGNNTFPFFDDFSGTTLDTSKWTITEGLASTVTVANSICNITPTSVSSITGMTNFGIGYRSRGRILSKSNTGWFTGFANYPTDSSHWVSIAGHSTGKWEYLSYNGAYSYDQDGGAWDQNYHIWEIMRVSSSSNQFYQDGILQKSDTTANTIPSGAFPMQSRCDKEVNLDWIFVTKYVSPEPSQGAWGSEETQTLGSDWVNDTWVAFSGTWSNVTKTVNSTVGATIAWCVYANDTSNNWNGTSCSSPFSYTTTGATFISISVSQALINGIMFGALNPNTNDNSALNNSDGEGGGTAYNITIDSSTNVNVDLYHDANENLVSGSSIIVIGNVTHQANTTSNTGNNLVSSGSIALSATYSIIGSICQNLGANSDCWIRYWLDSPQAQPPGNYNTTYEYCAVENGIGYAQCG